jgi:hypothetical protein
MKLSVATWAVLAVLVVGILVATKAVQTTVAIIVGVGILFLGSFISSYGGAMPLRRFAEGGWKVATKPASAPSDAHYHRT